MVVAVFGRCFACRLFKQAAKIVKIKYAAVLSDGLYLQLGVFK